MAGVVKVKGLKELQKFLDELTPKLAQNVCRGGLRAGMVKAVKPAAVANVKKVSGLLASGLKVKTSNRNGIVTSRLVATGKHASVAHLVEYGTRPHVITAKLKGWLSFGGLLRRVVHHPGAKPGPFMRPALDSQATAAVVACAEYMKKRLETKYGLDTADVEISAEGNE